MKDVLILLIVFQSLTIYAQEFDDYTGPDSISIELNELMDIDYKFKIIFDDFINNIPSNCQNLKETSIISVIISAHVTFRPSDSLITLLYKDNEFEKGIFCFPYLVSLNAINVESRQLNYLTVYSNLYHINYKGYNIIITPELELRFPWVGSITNKNYYLSDQEIPCFEYFSVYKIGDYEVEKIEYIKLFSQPFGVPLKDKYFKDRAKSDSLRYSK